MPAAYFLIIVSRLHEIMFCWVNQSFLQKIIYKQQLHLVVWLCSGRFLRFHQLPITAHCSNLLCANMEWQAPQNRTEKALNALIKFRHNMDIIQYWGGGLENGWQMKQKRKAGLSSSNRELFMGTYTRGESVDQIAGVGCCVFFFLPVLKLCSI